LSQKNLNLKDWIQSQQHKAADAFVLPGKLRKPSLEVLNAGIFPGPKQEEWRYTPVKELLGIDLNQTGSATDLEQKIAEAKTALPEACHLVFLDGEYASHYSDPLTKLKGLTLTQFSAGLTQDLPALEKMIAQAEWSDNNIFKDLSLSMGTSATLLEIGSSNDISQPLQIIHLESGTAGHAVSTPLLFITLGENSRFTLSEHFGSNNGSASCTFPATFISIAEGAHFTHFKVGLESDAQEHVSNTHVDLAKDASYTGHQYLLGSKMTRSNTEIKHSGPGSETTLRGIYLGEHSQHLDLRTYIDHAVPNCNSDQHFRGILNDQSRGVFNGLVLVRPDAQHTDAQQSNKNLLLSQEARVDTKPQLEIFADDVKCAHGATVGQLDLDALFYLQSRGIGKKDAILMLTRAFTAEVSNDIGLESLRTWVEDAIIHRLTRLADEHA
jgi:Fe-S cluster assembly protein SufD